PPISNWPKLRGTWCSQRESANCHESRLLTFLSFSRLTVHSLRTRRASYLPGCWRMLRLDSGSYWDYQRQIYQHSSQRQNLSPSAKIASHFPALTCRFADDGSVSLWLLFPTAGILNTTRL